MRYETTRLTEFYEQQGGWQMRQNHKTCSLQFHAETAAGLYSMTYSVCMRAVASSGTPALSCTPRPPSGTDKTRTPVCEPAIEHVQSLLPPSTTITSGWAVDPRTLVLSIA